MQISAFTKRVRTDNRKRLRHSNAFSRDLRNAIYHDTRAAIRQISRAPEFYSQFIGQNNYDTCRNVHRFLRSNFLYLRDPSDRQMLQLPSRFMRTLHGDCKSYSILCFSILYCCRVPVAYKFASYPHPVTGKIKPIPSHIYCKSDNTIIDGTSPLFDFEKKPGYSFTINPMKVETLSGSDFTASEVLKLSEDEVLSSEAAAKFHAELKAMPRATRRRFLKKFNPANRMKLIRSVKSYAKQQQLNHYPPDGGIGAVAGVDSDFVADDSEPIAGKRRDARKAKRAARKQARKEGMSKKAARQIGRATKKETKGRTERQKIKAKILRAKATGDKEALKAAKAERKANIKSNLKKVGKTFAKINPVLAAGRGAFLGMVRLNLRGFASNMAEMLKDNAGGDLRRKWEAIGGKWSRLTKAIDKGKGRKALLGKRNISDELSDIYGNRSVNGSDFIADGGASAGGATAAVAAPVLAAMVPIIVKFLKGKGKDTTDLENDVSDATSSESKGRLAKFVDKVADWVDDHPVIDDAIEAGRTTLAEKFEAKAEDILGKDETDPEAEESESGVSPLVWLAGAGIAIYAIKKAA